MIIGIGTDIIEVDRIKDSIVKYEEHFLRRIYTDTEREYCELFGEGKYLHYAARFAAKESFSKAIGTGITDGFKFKEVEVKNETSGKPVIILSGSLLEKYGQYICSVSLSHTQGYAIAYLILESK